MLEQLKILTLTHKRTNLKQIGQYVVKANDEAALQTALHDLKSRFGLTELLYLATCNRVMFLMVNDEPLEDSFVRRFFSHINPSLDENSLANLSHQVQAFAGMAAVEHLYEVAASMDSLVVGERQILGQLRDAYDQCLTWGLTGDGLRLLFQNAVLAAKAIYAQTRIGDKPVSVASLAIQQLLRHHLPHDARIVIIGAGQTNALVAKFLAKHHFNQVTVFNRTIEKAQTVANIVGGKALPLSALPSFSEGFDALIVCTGAAEPVVTPQVYQQLLAGDTQNKMVVDLSVPHNVAAEVVEQFPIQYIEIEGLRHLAQDNLAFRERELEKAKTLLASHLAAFPEIWRQRQVELAMRRVPEEIKAVKEKALNEVFRKEVDELDEHAREVLVRMLSYMEKKCIGIPMRAAREATM